MAMMLEEPLVRQQQKRLLKGTKRKHLSEEPETGLFGTLHDCTVPRASSIPDGHMDTPAAVKRPKLKIKFGGAPVKTILEKQVDRRPEVAGYGVEDHAKLTIEIPGLAAPSTDRLHAEAGSIPVGKTVRPHEPSQAPTAEQNASEGGAKQIQGLPSASQSSSPPQQPAAQDQNVAGSTTGPAATVPHPHVAAEPAAGKQELQASARAQQAEQPGVPVGHQEAPQPPPEPTNETQRPAPVLQHRAPVGHQGAAAQASGPAHGEPANTPAAQPGEQASVGVAATGEQPIPKHVAALREEREPGETSRSASSSHSSSSSSSSSSSGSSDSSDSESDRRRSRRRGKRRRPRTRSREPGEHSEGERQGGGRHSMSSYSRSRSRSPSSTADRGYHADGLHWRDRYERRQGERGKRFSRDRGERRSERGYDRPSRDRDLRSSPDDRRGKGRGRRSSREQSREPAPAASRERAARAPSRLGDPSKAVRRGEEAKQPGYAGVPDEHGPAARPGLPYLKSGAVEQRKSLPRNGLASEGRPVAFGFADAWNLLQGCAQSDVVGESKLDELHSQAVKAKHAITAIAKGQNGKLTLENLVALMRDSYLVFLQFCAGWEAALLQPTQNPRRTRAKLADENGFYPGTINLMHQLAKDAASCPANSVACKVLRLLAERLVGIMHVRVLTVQRYKIQQDRKLLLACPGAPCVDIYGRRQPGPADTSPGETFQRPSPTDSNASNSTGELAVSPALANRPSTAGTPPPSKPAGKPAAGKPAAKAAAGKASSLAEARAAKAAARPEQAVQRSTPLHTPQHTPPREEAPRGKPAAAPVAAKKPVPTPRNARDDAWQVEPPAWQIPRPLFESEMRSWNVIGGVTSAAAHSRAHCKELASLMRVTSPDVREAAGMLGFLDLGIGASNIGVVLQLSRKVLQLVLKIAAVNPPVMEAG